MHSHHDRTIEIRDEQGQTMTEYGVVISLITLTIVATIALLGSQFGAILGRVGGLLGG